MDGIAQVHDTNAAHPPLTMELRDVVRTDMPSGSCLVGTPHSDADGPIPGAGPYETQPIIATYPGDIFVTRCGTYRVVSWWRGAGSGR